MCNRFNSAVNIPQIEKMFSAKAAADLSYNASYNVAPTDRVPFIFEKDDQEREIHLGRFGMPTFATPVQTNIRLEKPQNLKFLKSRRCIIPSPGFYEFAAIGPKEKQAHYFTPTDPDGLFAYAGSWKETPNGLAFAIFTTEPNEIVAPVHDRMPVILTHNTIGAWLSKDADAESLQQMVQSYPASLMQSRTLSKTVNSVKNKGAECLNSQ